MAQNISNVDLRSVKNTIWHDTIHNSEGKNTKNNGDDLKQLIDYDPYDPN